MSSRTQIVDVENMALAQGMRDTRATLRGWANDNWRVLRTWLAGSLAITTALLLTTWLIASVSTPDPGLLGVPGIAHVGDLDDVAWILFRNSLVLALHGFACVAGFIAGSSLPLQARHHTGWWRWVHDKAGPLAIAFVIAATTFSLGTQAFVLGAGATNLAAYLHMSPGLLLLGVLPHALPELTALFLPLAAWIIASRRDEWHHLLAATFVTVALAVPVLIASAMTEVYLSPHILNALSG